jgi:hypothetical protein
VAWLAVAAQCREVLSDYGTGFVRKLGFWAKRVSDEGWESAVLVDDPQQSCWENKELVPRNRRLAGAEMLCLRPAPAMSIFIVVGELAAATGKTVPAAGARVFGSRAEVSLQAPG